MSKEKTQQTTTELKGLIYDDYSVLPKNKNKLCPGSMADKYQLEINTVLSSYHTGSDQFLSHGLTSSDRVRWWAGLGKRRCLGSLPQ